MIDKNHWEEIQETFRLLRDKKALLALLEGHRQRRDGQIPAGKEIDEVFVGLQKTS